jgi:formylglycine-generating enzyme required for sulfatase activity
MLESNLPVTEVDALQAANFCQWIGRRLPTRAEWLSIATQGGRTTWPWGEEQPAPDRANLLYEPNSVAATSLGQLQAVGGRPAGATPEGIQDLIGNVWEWTATPWEKPGREGTAWTGDPAGVPERLIMEGGGYLTSITGLGTVTQPIDAQNSFRGSELGFRCVKGGTP